jgi:hypothetical protein
MGHPPLGEEVVQVRRCEERRPRTRANTLQLKQNRQILESECAI